MIILLCLPGSLVPGKGIFSLPNLDKFVHVFLFGTNVLFWGWHYGHQRLSIRSFKQAIILDVVFTIALGIALEYVQKYWIPNRTFDSNDIIADAVGACLGGIWLFWRSARRSI